MTTSNLLSHTHSPTESAAASIYETIRLRDEDSDVSDIEERAGLALNQRNLGGNFRVVGPNDARTESSCMKNFPHRDMHRRQPEELAVRS
jgi:hypothetical protein